MAQKCLSHPMQRPMCDQSAQASRADIDVGVSRRARMCLSVQLELHDRRHPCGGAADSACILARAQQLAPLAGSHAPHLQRHTSTADNYSSDSTRTGRGRGESTAYTFLISKWEHWYCLAHRDHRAHPRKMLQPKPVWQLPNGATPHVAAFKCRSHSHPSPRES